MTISIEKKELSELLEAVRSLYGYDFSDYAPSSIMRRITHFMRTRKIETLETLKVILLDNEVVFEEFVRELSVTVTEMFRDPSFYKYLREKVMKRLATYPVIKIWVAGCATGEEVYSIAILLQEAGLLSRSIIYATDINQRSIEIARQGIYALGQMKLHTQNYLHSGGENEFSEYYTAKYNSALINQSLKKNIIFSAHNLVTDRSFNEFQLISCRNVLIYFNQTLQTKVINLFYESLCPLGFLVLGNRETLLFSDRKDEMEVMNKKERVFMKRGKL